MTRFGADSQELGEHVQALYEQHEPAKPNPKAPGVLAQIMMGVILGPLVLVFATAYVHALEQAVWFVWSHT